MREGATAVSLMAAHMLAAVVQAQTVAPDSAALRNYAVAARAALESQPDAGELSAGQRNLLISELISGLAKGEIKLGDIAPSRAAALAPAAKALYSAARRRSPSPPFDDPVFNDNFTKNLNDLSKGWGSLVWGGVSACAEKPEQFPECVEVTANSSLGRRPGSGVVIGRRAVLTAAHTVQGATSIHVVLACESGGSAKCAVELPYERAPVRNETDQWDLAILLLKEPLPEGVVVPASPTITKTGEIDDCRVSAVTAAGYGACERFGGGGMGTRRVARGMLILSRNCSVTGPCSGQSATDPVQRFGCLRGIELVADSACEDGTYQDTCEGDSGGPMYFRNPQNGYVLAGVVRGAVTGGSAQCGDGGRYTRIDDPDVLAWINAQSTK